MYHTDSQHIVVSYVDVLLYTVVNVVVSISWGVTIFVYIPVDDIYA